MVRIEIYNINGTNFNQYLFLPSLRAQEVEEEPAVAAKTGSEFPSGNNEQGKE